MSPFVAAVRAFVARLGRDAVREALHSAVDAAMNEVAREMERAPRSPRRPPPKVEGPVDPVAAARAEQALRRHGHIKP